MTGFSEFAGASTLLALLRELDCEILLLPDGKLESL